MTTSAATVAPDDETYWAAIRAQYDVSPDFINLENGYYGMQARPVFEAYQRYQREVSAENSYFLRTRFAGRLAAAKQALAGFCGVAADELHITRNAVEALNIVLQGYPFASGDQVLCATHDYDSALDTLAMLEQRKQVLTVPLAVPLDPDSDAQIVALYEDAIGPRTRLLLLTHIVHRTGQIMPVAQIAAMARRHGVDVLVDASHAFCQLDVKLAELGADFVCLNLHKWLGAPLGVGLLHIRAGRIKEIAPLFGDVAHAPQDIAKFSNVGVLPPEPIMAIEDALAFHQAIGGANKEARLRYLKHYWLDRVAALPRLRMFTPRAPERSCAIASFGIDGMPAALVAQRLMDEQRIFTVVRALGDGQQAVRVTPHLHTSTAQLDALVVAIGALAR